MKMTPRALPSAVSQIVQGSGGGSSSSKSRTPVTAADSVQSKAMLSVLDLICEGQIKGLVAGDQSIFFDGTSLANADGSKNYTGYTWDFRDGRQDQTAMDAFDSVTTPYNSGVQLKKSNPTTLTISDDNCDRVRVIITIPSLLSQNSSTGDVSATTLQYQFSLSYNDGPFVPVNVSGTSSPVVTISDKSQSKYQREHIISMPKPGSNYKIRVTRDTADSTSTYLQNDTYVDSYYEIIDRKLTYPNSVLFGFTIDSEQFTSAPERAYLIDGLYVQIPSNYDPDTRTYAGVWDGSFKIGFTDNPAWILYDVLLSERYGLGRFIKPSQINISKLYTIGRYCDGLVDNGFGGLEPRFTLNTCIQAQADAYKVIQDICSVFRGMSYWSGGMVQLTQDSPADPVYLFNNSNVVDGLFSRTGSARKDRHSVVHVTWNDPDDEYKQKIEYVEDPDLINDPTVGYRKVDVVGFGCTSRAQAHRIGLWMLYTEKVETNIISFTVGLEGLQCMPGDIVKIQDQFYGGKRNSGRLKSCTRTGCKLDAPTQISIGATIAIRMPNGGFEERTVNQTGLVTDLTFTTQLSAVPMANTVWILTEANLVPVLGRCVSVAQGDKTNTFVISCVDHNPSKFASIEQGLLLETLPTTLIDPTFSAPENLKITEVTYLIAAGQLGSRLDVSWEGKSPNYFVSWRATDGNGASGWVTEQVNKASYSVYNVSGGTVYDFKVVSQSVTGKLSQEIVGTYVALGTNMPPSAPTELTAVGNFQQITLNWKNGPEVDLDYTRIYENTVDDVTTAYVLDRTPSTSYTRTGIPGLMKYWYWVKAVNKRGMESDFNSTAGTSAIAGVIAETDLDRNLLEKIEDNSEIIEEVDNKINAALVQTQQSLDDALAHADAARALVTIEQLFRDDADVQIQRSVNVLEVTLSDDINAKIQQVNETAASDRQSVARQFTDMSAKFDDMQAGLTQESVSRATQDDAFTTMLTELYTQTANNRANIISEYEARVNDQNALATTMNGVLTQTVSDIYGTVTAQFVAEQTARTDSDTALTNQIVAITARVGDNETAVTTQITGLIANDAAMADQINAVRATTEANSALISQEAQARTDADNAMATQIGAVQTQANNMQASFTDQVLALIANDTALTQRITDVQAKSVAFDPFETWQFDTDGDAEGWLSAGCTVTVVGGVLRVTATAAENYIIIPFTDDQKFKGQLYPLMRMRIKRLAGSTWNGVCYYATASHSISPSYVKVIANPAIAVGSTAVLDWDMSALSAGGTDWTDNTITGLRFDLGQVGDSFEIDWISAGRIAPGGGWAAVEETMKAQADTDGRLSTMWTIKLNMTSNGILYTAGMGIGIENTDQGIAQSQVVFQADRFLVFNPNVLTSAVAPFQVINDTVYINTAMIQVASIGTLFLAGEAVTIPRFAYIEGTVGYNANIISLTFTNDYAGVFQILFTVSMSGSGNTGQTVTSQFQMMGDGYQIGVTGQSTALGYSPPSFMISRSVTLQAGTHTVTINASGSGTYTPRDPTLLVLGVKR